ncbi:MAG TPA: IS4 family transposase, partial [Thermoanaerobaculia bacterium]
TLLQILSLTLFEKLDLAEALTPLSRESMIMDTANQQNLFDF